MSGELVDLVSHPGAAPFIYHHHPHHPSSTALPELPKRCHVVLLDTIEHHTPRIFYTSAIKQIDTSPTGDITSWDSFARVLLEAWTRKAGGPSRLNGFAESSIMGSSKGKGKTPNGVVMVRSEVVGAAVEEEQIVIVISHAERLRTVFGGNWPVITRLAELVCCLNDLDEPR